MRTHIIIATMAAKSAYASAAKAASAAFAKERRALFVSRHYASLLRSRRRLKKTSLITVTADTFRFSTMGERLFCHIDALRTRARGAAPRRHATTYTRGAKHFTLIFDIGFPCNSLTERRFN